MLYIVRRVSKIPKPNTQPPFSKWSKRLISHFPRLGAQCFHHDMLTKGVARDQYQVAGHLRTSSWFDDKPPDASQSNRLDGRLNMSQPIRKTCVCWSWVICCAKYRLRTDEKKCIQYSFTHPDAPLARLRVTITTNCKSLRWFASTRAASSIAPLNKNKADARW